MFKVLVINPLSKYRDYYGIVETVEDIFGDNELCFSVKLFLGSELGHVKLNFKESELLFLKKIS